MIGQVARFAGTKILPFLTKGIPKEQLAMRLGMDALGGGMSAMYTPGDLGDKLIAGVTDAGFSAVGGLALGRVGGPGFRAGLGGQMMDMAGSVGGMEVGRAVGDTAMRVKDKVSGGEGLTPFERLNKEQQEEMEKQIRAQLMQEYGMG